MSSTTLSKEVDRAIGTTLAGVLLMAIGAFAVLGFGGLLIVFGAFCTALGVVGWREAETKERR